MTSVFKKWQSGSILLTDAGWGDSGKGKVVTALNAQVGAKIIGGHNAGHTIVIDKGEFGLGLVPSNIINPHSMNVLSQEVVIDPKFLIAEIEKLNKGGVKVTPKNFMVDANSHVIMPWHSIRDSLSEEARGKAAIGSLHLGVGWTYSDRINRRGLRFSDLYSSDWKKRVENELLSQQSVISDMQADVKRKTGVKSVTNVFIDKNNLIKDFEKMKRYLIPFIGNTIQFVWKAIDGKKTIIFEDSHGAMLDVSHGSWPFTTGVNTSIGAVQRSFGGKASRTIMRIVTVVKAYQTRVGGGPMPTENFGNLGKYLQEHGGEVGTRSGRKRRCGPIDLPLIRYGLNIIGASNKDEIALTKLDVLGGLKKIPVCVAYKVGKNIYKDTPRVDANFLSNVKPIFTILPGWSEDISKIRSFVKLPVNARKYILFLEKHLGRKITFIGVGKHKDAKIII